MESQPDFLLAGWRMTIAKEEDGDKDEIQIALNGSACESLKQERPSLIGRRERISPQNLIVIYRSCYSTCYYTKRSALFPEMMLDNTQLSAIRKRLALSQEQMARLIGVSFATVNRWEGGSFR